MEAGFSRIRRPAMTPANAPKPLKLAFFSMDVAVNRQKKTKPATVKPVSQLGISRATASHRTAATIPGAIPPKNNNEIRGSHAATNAFAAILQTAAAIATRVEFFKIVV